MAPVRELTTPIKIIGYIILEDRSNLNRRSRGVSFCHVSRIEAEVQVREAIVEGNHWYIGAIPALVRRANSKNAGLRALQGVSQIAGLMRSKTDPVACARKYLHADLALSEERPIG